MKLRNKKTGEIADFKIHKLDGLSDDGNPIYRPFIDSIKDWEDAPKEPLIKDEKIRKAVRAWAEISGIKVVLVCETFNAWGVKNKANGNPEDEEYMLADILFRGEKPEELEFGKEYTIPELCGEEEE